MTETVSVFPSKHFFVDMLTRDIEFSEAILDLLDNCVDGTIVVAYREKRRKNRFLPLGILT